MELRLASGWRVWSDGHNFVLERDGDVVAYAQELAQAVRLYQRRARSAGLPAAWAGVERSLWEAERLAASRAEVTGQVALDPGWLLRREGQDVGLGRCLDGKVQIVSWHPDTPRALRHWLRHRLLCADCTQWAQAARLLRQAVTTLAAMPRGERVRPPRRPAARRLQPSRQAAPVPLLPRRRAR